jgi:flagellar motility protein MotE (MotC chaperone)
MKAHLRVLLGAGGGVLLGLAVGVGRSWMVLEPALREAAATARKPAPGAAEFRQKGWNFWTIEIENLSSELKDERLRLRSQAEALEQRGARLAAEERELAKVRAELERMRREIADQVVEMAADELKNVRSLATTYANLTPRGAVAIFREMDDVTVAKILAVMKPDVVGPIFEEMSRATGPDQSLARRAALLSERLRLLKAARPAATP